MKAMQFKILGALAMSLSACACIPSVDAPVATPAPAPAPVSTPAPTPTPAPPPPPPVVNEPSYANYLDAPQTPGDWIYAAESAETFAIYGNGAADPLAIVRCDLRTKRVGIGRYGVSRASAALRIKTETRNGTLEGVFRESVKPLVAAEINSRDPLLDAIAITKGRFALETDGVRTLYLPAWAEVTRVIEDCR